MSSLQYNNINLSVNGLYILADSLNFSESSPLKPAYALGVISPVDNTPSFLKGTVTINYYMEPLNEPNYPIILNMLSDPTIAQPSLISIGQSNITGYLTSYAFQLTPNGLIKTNCSFDIFYPLISNLAQQNSTDPFLYDVLNSSGISHYWSSQFYSGSNAVSDNKILQLNYSANINIIPIYGIGAAFPKQIYINGMNESLNVLTELQFNATYSGNDISFNRPDLQTLLLSGIASSGSISISMPGFLLNDSKFDIGTDNIILFNNTYSRSK